MVPGNVMLDGILWGGRSRLLQRVCFSHQASFSRVMVEADSPPASFPSSATRASSNSPVEVPFR
jgi:hypothetical protein